MSASEERDVISIGEAQFHPNVSRCHIIITKEVVDDETIFTADVINLPGVVSCGNTREEALEHVREAIEGAIESYKASELPLPWRSPEEYADEIEQGDESRWILVNG